MRPGHSASNRKTWEKIAASFDRTRQRTWPDVEAFIEDLRPGTRVLDAGCGNGRHLALLERRGIHPVGLDISRGLLAAARKRSPSARLVQGTVEEPPFLPGSFDAVIATAVLHHVGPASSRRRVVERWAQLLGPKAPMLISVWARDQPLFDGGDLEGVEGGEEGDVYLRWTQHGMDEPRFVHPFSEAELRSLVPASIKVERLWRAEYGRNAANYYVIGFKTE